MISKKLERIFNKSNMKIDDVILSVGDEEEMMEVVRRFSDVNSNSLKELTEEELRREIQKYEEEFSAVMADMRTMREEQAGERQEVLLTMIIDLEEAVIRDQAKLEGIVKELAEAEQTEQRLREELSRLRSEEDVQRHD